MAQLQTLSLLLSLLLSVNFVPCLSFLHGPLRSSRHSLKSAYHVRYMSAVKRTETPDVTMEIKTRTQSSSPFFIDGPPPETKPDYETIHGPLGKTLDRVFLAIFRTRMAEKVGIDSKLPKDDYQGLTELTTALNSRYSDRREIQKIAQDILISLFPSWIPGLYPILFSKPFPEFSCRMNAWATKWFGTWLMGECEINDAEVDGSDGIATGIDQGLLVKRCRFLEESKCASVCVNSCKIPTQNFFMENMGLPLTMTPDYETGECQFSFGLTPNENEEAKAKLTPCFSACPSSGGMRMWHDGKGGKKYEEAGEGIVATSQSQCSLMGVEDQDN